MAKHLECNIQVPSNAHSLGVARLMKSLAPLYGLNPEKMFMLGYLHDIGYELTDKPELHNFEGGDSLRENVHYEYWREVYWHGVHPCPFTSKALDLLNYADMSIDKKGQQISIEQRLKSIKDRYGENSLTYVRAYALSKTLVLPDPPPMK